MARRTACERALALTVAVVAAFGCQASLGGGGTASVVPEVARALPVYFESAPALGAVEDDDARPFAVTLAHQVRDAIEEAGLVLAPSPEAASGVVIRLRIDKLAAIHADAFIKGSEACGVTLEVLRKDAQLAKAETESPCVSTSPYYGVSPREAALALVSLATHAPRFVAAVSDIRPGGPPPLSAASAAPDAAPDAK